MQTRWWFLVYSVSLARILKKKKVGGVFCSHLRSRSGRCRGGASLPWNAGAAEPATAHLAPGRAPKFLLSCGRRRGEAAARGRPARCPAGRPGVGGGRGCGLRARGGAGGGATARPAPPRGPFCGRDPRRAVVVGRSRSSAECSPCRPLSPTVVTEYVYFTS